MDPCLSPTEQSDEQVDRYADGRDEAAGSRRWRVFYAVSQVCNDHYVPLVIFCLLHLHFDLVVSNDVNIVRSYLTAPLKIAPATVG